MAKIDESVSDPLQKQAADLSQDELISEAAPQGKSVVVGMSGGVDSAVAAAELQAAGYNVIGVTLILWKEDQEEERPWQDRSCCKVGLARHVAGLLSIPHHTLDVQQEFQAEIIDDFCDTYLMGETPNPCVRCNERMKFGRLLSAARALGADTIATGHYAQVACGPSGGHRLLRSVDAGKDQTYFLYRMSQDHLAHTLFPLGGMTKEAVYQKAAALGLPYEDILESQEVCFVNQTGYREFLSMYRPEAATPGRIVTESGEAVGQHAGVAHYTVGQRKGLGIAASERLYVTRLDPARGEVVVGPEARLYQDTLIAREIIWGGGGLPTSPMAVSAKVRYRTPDQPAILTPLSNGNVHLQFESPQRGVAPGQSVVFYRDDEVIGGGIIAPA